MSQPFNNLLLNPLFMAEGPLGNTGGMGSMDIFSELMKDDDAEVIDLEDTKKVDDKKEEKDDKKSDKTEKDDTDTGRDKDTDEKDDDKEDEEEKEEEVDELAELEAELEGPPEEKLQLMTPSRRKDILKDFPDIFKKHPYLETAYYRDQKFTEVFPTIKEAEEAAASLGEYKTLQSKLKSGDIEQVITDIKKDEKAFFKMVDNYLPTLNKVAPEAYLHLVGNLVKYTVEDMVTESKARNNDSLKTAASILHDFVFGTTKWTPPSNLSKDARPEDNKASDELAKREREFNERKFNSAQSEIGTKVDNSIKATIVQHIDPKSEMTDFVKNAAVSQALKQVESLVSKDTRFKTLLDRLWQNAADKDFAKPEMDKIKSACISKARTLLPSVIKTARHEALKGLGKRSKTEDKDKEEDTVSEPKRESASPRSKADKGSKNTVPAGMSSYDYLMQD